MKIVYVSGPYTGNVCVNVKNAMDVAQELIELGFAPYVPHLSHFMEINHPNHYETWMNIDMEFVRKCDYIIRIEGESSGADREVELAKSLNIPVFYSIYEFNLFLHGKS